ncbi:MULTISPECIES: hypothetical protein [unclassified Rhizobium]|uniref:Uncharacterized protein n=2 Tax=Rhizobium tropici TaxID=398 RepID=A0A329Y830_RHITR|nr:MULTISPECIES: hypothetical protein [unclassified Rhizobium]RAX39991.1 hypothetical protein DQ393_19255 [Rhizobium tropici]MBB3290049.1 hypothetical protein [Rhizobium sp. BK252]MBB3404831.1 hypothetical protein [Rhizobium sp. BK289]MBB3417291.1 hypothetical protein [Rhizobium sp. BK284]MBB3485406.1 hypothetical protein [Rhizobium sp. BK347]
MPTQLNKTAAGRRATFKPHPQTPMFTKEWSFPAILTVFLFGVCGLIAYFTWTLMPPATPMRNHVGSPITLTDHNGQTIADRAPAPEKQP